MNALEALAEEQRRRQDAESERDDWRERALTAEARLDGRTISGTPRSAQRVRLTCGQAGCGHGVIVQGGDPVNVLDGWSFDGRTWTCPNHDGAAAPAPTPAGHRTLTAPESCGATAQVGENVHRCYDILGHFDGYHICICYHRWPTTGDPHP